MGQAWNEASSRCRVQQRCGLIDDSVAEDVEERFAPPLLAAAHRGRLPIHEILHVDLIIQTYEKKENVRKSTRDKRTKRTEANNESTVSSFNVADADAGEEAAGFFLLLLLLFREEEDEEEEGLQPIRASSCSFIGMSSSSSEADAKKGYVHEMTAAESISSNSDCSSNESKEDDPEEGNDPESAAAAGRFFAIAFRIDVFPHPLLPNTNPILQGFSVFFSSCSSSFSLTASFISSSSSITISSFEFEREERKKTMRMRMRKRKSQRKAVETDQPERREAGRTQRSPV